ncbi:MAG: enoyl-CoA hydratase/isomerase family protein [Candidatus Dormibacteraeota bacterium]|nr:enoyl-CoA hydratase/isomerase family protein [Candidatus Dormibacteraeota bacterium]
MNPVSATPDLEQVLVRLVDRVATVTLNRPEQRNALSDAMLRDLLAALAWCRDHAGVGAVVLTGAGDRAFCAGADLTSFEEQVPELERHRSRHRLVELFLLTQQLGRPLVGRINGHALAGGFGLACACDLLVAVEQATFGTPEVNVGLWPAMIQAVLARNLPRKVLLEMELLGDRWTAYQLKQLGLVNRVVGSHEELDAVSYEIAATLAAKSPAVLGIGLRSFYTQQDMEFRAALEYLQSQLSLVSLTEDAGEGVRAFLQKRKPEWRGR